MGIEESAEIDDEFEVNSFDFLKISCQRERAIGEARNAKIWSSAEAYHKW